MAFSVELMVNNSPVEKIGKDLTAGPTLTGVTLKHDCSVLKPVLHILSASNIYNYNYMYIPHFSRFYFIDDIISAGQNRWEVAAHVDPLETYKQQILDNSAIIHGTEQTGRNKYLHDQDAFVVNCKHKTDIIQFPSGLLDTGEFILITAGG